MSIIRAVPKISQNFFRDIDFTDNRLLVELLEDSIIREIVAYRLRLADKTLCEKFDKTFIPKFISEDLMADFKEWIYVRVNKLNNFEINKFLSLSLEQFNTHKPENRKAELEWLYHFLYFYPHLAEDQKLSKYDKDLLFHTYRSYERCFNSFKSVTKKALTDFKAGLIGGNATFQTIPPDAQKKEKILLRDYKIFIKHLAYNSPNKVDVVTFKYYIDEDIDYLKKEILDNLIRISKEEKVEYLSRLKYEIESFQKNVWASQDDIKPWLDKYEIKIEDVITSKDFENDLYLLLCNEPTAQYEAAVDNCNKENEKAIAIFYNYYYGQALRQVIGYIEEHEAKINPSAKPNTSDYKSKTKLTVPQLAYLLRVLNNNTILDIANKTEFFKFIAEHCQTVGSDKISWQSLKNKFDTPDIKAVEFWDEKFLHLRQSTQSDMEKL
jgi:hypothetical protein